MRARILALALLWHCVAETNAAHRIWIDTDPAIGAPWREVDDAFALLLALNSPELEIAGISTTYGNAGLGRTTDVARKFLQRAGREIPVHPGARSAREIDGQTQASNALAQALRSGRLTYVALGPLTNLAAFLHAHPALAGEIEQVVFVGGRLPNDQLAFGRNGWLRVHDANVVKDPEAVRRIFRSEIPITVAPAKLSARLMLNRSDLARIGTTGGAGAFLRRRSAVWVWFWTSLVGERGGPLFDALALLACIQPRLIETDECFGEMTRSGELLLHQTRLPDRPRVRCCTSFRPETEDLLVERLAR